MRSCSTLFVTERFLGQQQQLFSRHFCFGDYENEVDHVA